MKNSILFPFIAALLGAFFQIGPVLATTITDSYVGADPTHKWPHVDVIGEDQFYDISKMNVSTQDGNLVVDVYTRYLNNIGSDQTLLGDLFVSTNGWQPYGTAPYKEDWSDNGEIWEFALVLDHHGPGYSFGDASLFHINDGTILDSGLNGLNPDRYVYRAGQEAQFTPGDNVKAAGKGSWEIFDGGTIDDGDDYLRFVIGYSALGPIGPDLGFHWTMTCGNDVIEGSAPAPVPEPATMLLFGTGLAGLAGGLRRKKA